VDDVLARDDLATLVAGAGPQVVLVLTTQQAPEVMAELQRWLPRDHLAQLVLSRMQEEEAYALVDKVLQRPLRQQEWETVRRVAEMLGWHPEGVRLAAAMTQDEPEGPRGKAEGTGWAGVLALLQEEGLRTEGWDPLRRLVERQWERLGPMRRKWVERLVWRTERGGPLEEPLAAAIWEVEPAAARLRLRNLEQVGMLERVAVHPVEWWRERELEMWRVTPVVYRLHRDQAGTLRKVQHQLDRTLWRARTLTSRPWQRHVMPPMPLSLALAGGIPNLLVVLPRLLVEGIVKGLARLKGKGEQVRQWSQRMTLGLPSSRLRARWEQLWLQPTEEVELLYVEVGWTVSAMTALETLTALGLIGLGLLSVSRLPFLPPLVMAGLRLLPTLQAATPWIVAALWIGMGVFLAKLIWLCVLYGVRTWDLALVVHLALALSWPLQWLGPVRRERERLKDAWERGKSV